MPDRFRRGDAIRVPAAEYNALAAALEQDYGLTAAGGLLLQRGPTGRALALPKDPCTYATLSGTTSPYSWTEAYPQSGGTFAAGVRTGATNAYEANATASLAGKVVRICPGYPGDWRFYNRHTATCVTLAVHVTGCGALNLAGMQITFTKTGAPTVVVTTDASGNATALLTVAGTWTYATSKTRWNNTTGFNNYTCSGASQGFTLNMGSGVTNAATGFQCSNLCADPVSNTLTFNDGINPALTLPKNTITGLSGWSACALRTVTGPPLRNCLSGTTGQVATIYSFDGTNLQITQPVLDVNGDGIPETVCTTLSCSSFVNWLNGVTPTGCNSFDLLGGTSMTSTLRPAGTATSCTAGSMAFSSTFTTEASAATLVSWASIYGASTSKTFTWSE